MPHNFRKIGDVFSTFLRLDSMEKMMWAQAQRTNHLRLFSCTYSNRADFSEHAWGPCSASMDLAGLNYSS